MRVLLYKGQKHKPILSRQAKQAICDLTGSPMGRWEQIRKNELFISLMLSTKEAMYKKTRDKTTDPAPFAVVILPKNTIDMAVIRDSKTGVETLKYITPKGLFVV